MQKAQKFKYLGKFEAKINTLQVVNQELKWVLLAKPVQHNKSHASAHLRAE
jgi:hypothetical protein